MQNTNTKIQIQPCGTLDNAKYNEMEKMVSMEDLEKMFSGFPGVFQVISTSQEIPQPYLF